MQPAKGDAFSINEEVVILCRGFVISHDLYIELQDHKK